MPIPRSIEHFLGDRHVTYSVIPHRPAYTAQEEAAVAHMPGSQWAKTVACLADDRPNPRGGPGDIVFEAGSHRATDRVMTR
jgi:hypothetical protein